MQLYMGHMTREFVPVEKRGGPDIPKKTFSDVEEPAKANGQAKA